MVWFAEGMDRLEENISKRFDQLEKIVAQLAASSQECPMQ